jgi:8-oxo-dGTP pyrophosphatase MutT (NUDIX family)
VNIRLIHSYPAGSRVYGTQSHKAIRTGNLLVFDSAGAILAGRRSGQSLFEPGKWTLPGGRCERNESFREAARRELGEEFGILLPSSKIRVFRCYTALYSDRTVLAAYFVAFVSAGQPIALSHREFSQGGFFPIHQASRWRWAFSQRQVLRDFLRIVPNLTS